VATEDPLEVLKAIHLWRDLWHGRTIALTSTHPDTCKAEISLGCSLLVLKLYQYSIYIFVWIYINILYEVYIRL